MKYLGMVALEVKSTVHFILFDHGRSVITLSCLSGLHYLSLQCILQCCHVNSLSVFI